MLGVLNHSGIEEVVQARERGAAACWVNVNAWVMHVLPQLVKEGTWTLLRVRNSLIAFPAFSIDGSSNYKACCQPYLASKCNSNRTCAQANRQKRQ